MSLVNSASKVKFLKAVITHKEKIAAHTYHLKVQGDDIKSIDYTPGMHMKVVVGLNEDASLNTQVRSYSIWDFDAAHGTLDIAVCTHSEGLGAKWIEAVQPGADFYFFIKKTIIADNSADNYFFIGDVSTLGHFYKVMRALSTNKKIYSFIYSGIAEDFFADIDGSKPFDFYIQPSDKLSPAPVAFLQEKLASVFTEGKATANNTIAYIGGDARVCAALTPYLVQQFNFNPDKIKMKSFWNPDKVREE